MGHKWIICFVFACFFCFFWHHFHCALYLDVVRKRFIIVPFDKVQTESCKRRAKHHFKSYNEKHTSSFWSAAFLVSRWKNKLPWFTPLCSGKDIDRRKEMKCIRGETFSTYYSVLMSSASQLSDKVWGNCEHISRRSVLTVEAGGPMGHTKHSHTGGNFFFILFFSVLHFFELLNCHILFQFKLHIKRNL